MVKYRCRNKPNSVKKKQVRFYRIRIKKCITAYSSKLIKIYQRCGLLSRDSLGLSEHYSMRKGLILKSYSYMPYN